MLIFNIFYNQASDSDNISSFGYPHKYVKSFDFYMKSMLFTIIYSWYTSLNHKVAIFLSFFINDIFGENFWNLILENNVKIVWKWVPRVRFSKIYKFGEHQNGRRVQSGVVLSFKNSIDLISKLHHYYNILQNKISYF